MNDMPELENFIRDNKLGEFTGMVRQSGYCSYPLYMFDAKRLRELCPDGMAVYEHNIKRKPKTKKHEKIR